MVQWAPMKSRRTISYIGLWALIMPWLGFSWETKTVLFSLTGLMLLFIGNRYYHSEKSPKLDEPAVNPEPTPKEEPVIIAQSIKTYDDVPNYMEPTPSASTPKEEVVELTQESVEIEQPAYYKPVLNSEPELVEEETVVAIKPVHENNFSKPVKTKVRKSMEILPKLRRSHKPISLDTLDSGENNNEI